MQYKYAVIGNPIEHSLSPNIHQVFANQCNIDLAYHKIKAKNFKKTVNNLIKENYDGFNITLPFKIDAYKIANKLDKAAMLSKAVNTIKILNGKIYGYNTDGIGIKTDLTKNLRLDISNRLVLILGAGGASRGIIAELLTLRPKRIMIANRTEQKAIAIAKEFAHLGNTCGFTFDKIKNLPVDLIINATSVAAGDELPNINAECVNGSIFYDLSYNGETRFMQWAKKNQAKSTHNGWGMLVEQAYCSFKIWHKDAKINTAEIISRPLIN